MTKTEVLDLLKENRDARGEANWKAMGDRTGGLISFGIGLTKLRAIAKQVGRDHDLALTLWNERNHEHLTSDYLRNKLGVCGCWLGRNSPSSPMRGGAAVRLPVCPE